MTDLAERFQPIPAERARHWHAAFPPSRDERERRWFSGLVGLVLEEMRLDYARMRMPYRPDLAQPVGVVHGGAIATLVDTAVVPAVASRHDGVPRMLTISMTIDYMKGLRDEDAIAEAWVEKRGARIVFCRAEVRSASGAIAARASLVYDVKG